MGKKAVKEPVAEVYDSVTDGLKALYKAKIKPVEEVRENTCATAMAREGIPCP